MSKKSSLEMKELCDVVAEFLGYHKYISTLEEFENERASRNNEGEAPNTARSEQISTSRSKSASSNHDEDDVLTPDQKIQYKEKMKKYLSDAAAAAEFFQLWCKCVPASMRTCDPETIKIEFNLRLYYYVRCLQQQTSLSSSSSSDPILARNLQQQQKLQLVEFKEFVSKRAGALSLCTELHPYYALPYVPAKSLHSHPSFQHLFTDVWQKETKSSFEAFMQQIVTQNPKEPLLHRLLTASVLAQQQQQQQQQPSPPQTSYDRQIEQLKEEFAAQAKRMQEMYHKLYSVANYLLKATDGALRGKKLNEEFVKMSKQRIDDLSPERVLPADLLGSVDMTISRPQSSMIYSSSRGSTRSGRQDVLFAPIDYTKVKEELASKANASTVTPYLLQALMWRITKNRAGHGRKQAVLTYVNNDLFCLAHGTNLLFELLDTQASSAGSRDVSGFVREYTLRLVNAMSSETSGRNYLLSSFGQSNRREQGLDLIHRLVSIICEEETDTISRQNAVMILQKFSLRILAQRWMISCGVVEALCHILSNGAHECSDITVEYGTALLMNISLNTTNRAKLRFEQSDPDILAVLADLLEHENLQVRTYVNGCLYSILRSSVQVRDRARSIAMPDMIQYVMTNSDPDLAKQLQYILDVLQAPDDAEQEEFSRRAKVQEQEEEEAALSSEEEYDQCDGADEDDYVFTGEETLPKAANLPTGEDLLCSRFLASTERARQEVADLRTSMDLAALRQKQTGGDGSSDLRKSFKELTLNFKRPEESTSLESARRAMSATSATSRPTSRGPDRPSSVRRSTSGIRGVGLEGDNDDQNDEEDGDGDDEMNEQTSEGADEEDYEEGEEEEEEEGEEEGEGSDYVIKKTKTRTAS